MQDCRLVVTLMRKLPTPQKTKPSISNTDNKHQQRRTKGLTETEANLRMRHGKGGSIAHSTRMPHALLPNKNLQPKDRKDRTTFFFRCRLAFGSPSLPRQIFSHGMDTSAVATPTAAAAAAPLTAGKLSQIIASSFLHDVLAPHRSSPKLQRVTLLQVLPCEGGAQPKNTQPINKQTANNKP